MQWRNHNQNYSYLCWCSVAPCRPWRASLHAYRLVPKMNGFGPFWDSSPHIPSGAKDGWLISTRIGTTGNGLKLNNVTKVNDNKIITMTPIFIINKRSSQLIISMALDSYMQTLNLKESTAYRSWKKITVGKPCNIALMILMLQPHANKCHKEWYGVDKPSIGTMQVRVVMTRCAPGANSQKQTKYWNHYMCNNNDIKVDT